MTENELSAHIVDLCFKIHKQYGPGLYESIYEEVFCFEWNRKGIPFKRQFPIPFIHETIRMEAGFRADVIIDGKVLVEIKSIEETESEIVDEFSLFDSWDEKYEYIIDLGKKPAPLEEQYKKDENKVKGCQSTVWLVADYRNGRVYFKAESNSVIVQGLISLLIRVLSGQKPDRIVEAKLEFLNEIGMMTHLAQTRSNGLLAMVKQMKSYALAYKLKHESV